VDEFLLTIAVTLSFGMLLSRWRRVALMFRVFSSNLLFPRYEELGAGQGRVFEVESYVATNDQIHNELLE
jgi:hypothetical protein